MEEDLDNLGDQRLQGAACLDGDGSLCATSVIKIRSLVLMSQAQQLRTLITLPEYLGLIPRTHRVAHGSL